MGAYAPIGLVIAAFDFILKPHHKEKLFSLFARAANLGRRPISLRFYVLILGGSIFFTFAILSITGSIESLVRSGEKLSTGVKSSGSLIAAVVFKIVILDYILALKTATVIGMCRAVGRVSIRGPAFRKTVSFVLRFLLVTIDLVATIGVTALTLNWWEVFQESKLEPAMSQDVSESFRDFFDTINLVVQDTLKHSFYVLNGSLMMYLVAAVSGVAKGTVTHLNVNDITTNICKIIAAFLAAGILLIAIIHDIATRAA